MAERAIFSSSRVESLIKKGNGWRFMYALGVIFVSIFGDR